MDYRRFGSKLFIRIDKSEEILKQLQIVCTKEMVRLAEVKALGALSEYTVGLFDPEKRSITAEHFKDLQKSPAYGAR